MLSPIHSPKDSLSQTGYFPSGVHKPILRINPRYVFRASYPPAEEQASERRLFSRIRAVLKAPSGLSGGFSLRTKAESRLNGVLMERSKIIPSQRLATIYFRCQKPAPAATNCRSLHKLNPIQRASPVRPVMEARRQARSKRYNSDLTAIKGKLAVRKPNGRNLSVKIETKDQIVGWSGEDSFRLE